MGVELHSRELNHKCHPGRTKKVRAIGFLSHRSRAIVPELERSELQIDLPISSATYGFFQG